MRNCLLAAIAMISILLPSSCLALRVGLQLYWLHKKAVSCGLKMKECHHCDSEKRILHCLPEWIFSFLNSLALLCDTFQTYHVKIDITITDLLHTHHHTMKKTYYSSLNTVNNKTNNLLNSEFRSLLLWTWMRRKELEMFKVSLSLPATNPKIKCTPSTK